MKHFFEFFPWLFSLVGLDHFGHEYHHIIFSWVAMIILIGLSVVAAKTITMIPGKGQNVLEIIVGGLEEFMVGVVGEEGRWFLPLAATLFLYILVCNLMGLLPGFFPPTANVNTPLSCAIVVFCFTHFLGIKHHGAKYIKHFMGPILALTPLFLILETISHLARVLSLTFRLFGNMMGHELVLMILFFLAGAFLAPLPIMAMGILVAVVQAFVFFMLSIMYFAGSIEHAH
ncbi:ATP synthase F0 subcomplex A subunit [Desulfatibacillum alkenivorans DSM 16219]|uniref:ATP synthase subunit a n=1 Tax=Desulfatibacillum alkenivorans DSM 16219 TaxID=1121393 RepID=A0A1M6GN59_9BACT|nr:F0F1 ATP synthase subunit A [Desulfatibacillum alkenivorans]SHJ11414.1 ATP synthase F0 subcomplex A subunit [Desulfatibacillum alkenivorans DSM 16219]